MDHTNYFRPPATLDDEAKLRHDAGSYKFLCSVGGHIMFSHRPVGTVVYVVRR